MGIGYSKCKRKKKRINNQHAVIIEEKDNLDVLTQLKNESDSEDCNEERPVLKWKKATPKEEIVKIQQAAEIKDIETIYQNSAIEDYQIMNKMPDHYWAGRENKLPRYVEYRGDYPNSEDKKSNLHKLKSSSFKDLSDCTSLNFVFDDKQNDSVRCNDSNSIKVIKRSISCPILKMTLVAKPTTPNETPAKNFQVIPSKGILKKKNANRPISTLILENQNAKLPACSFDAPKDHQILQNGSVFGDCSDATKPHINDHSTTPVNSSSLTSSDTSQQIDELNPDKDQSSNSLNYCYVKSDSDNSIVGTKKGNTNDANDNDDDDNKIEIYDNGIMAYSISEETKQLIKENLDKRLNLRPSSTELTNRNILHAETESERSCGLERKKSFLNEKLQSRPTINELKTKKIIKFNDFIEVKETDNYDRSVNKTWSRLTDYDRANIRNELNELKKEMIIHQESKSNTRFHDPISG